MRELYRLWKDPPEDSMPRWFFGFILFGGPLMIVCVIVQIIVYST